VLLCVYSNGTYFILFYLIRLTKPICSLRATLSLKEHQVVIASTLKQNVLSLNSEDDLEHSFSDLSLKKAICDYQLTSLPLNSNTEFKLSAPPPWKLDRYLN